MRNIEDLHPRLQEIIKKIKIRCENEGLKIGISECLRTIKEQDELYAQGRTKPGNIVTNAKGSTYSSMHQWGIAFDFYRNDGKGAYENKDKFFEKVGKIGKSFGLEWGGDWKSIKDTPHFQLPDWGSTTKKLKELYKTPENFFKSWEELSVSQYEELKERIKELDKKISDKSEIMIYDYVDDNMPNWARPTIKKLRDASILKGDEDGRLNLNDDMLRILVMLDRTGVFDIN